MKKAIVYIAMSLDGYIADKDGGVAWLGGDGSDTENMGSYPAFIESVDTILLGYQTYHQIVTELAPDAWPYCGKTCYVLTHKDLADNDNVCFTSRALPDLLRELKAQDGKDIWICGGATIIQQLHMLDLIDIYAITVIPTLLGDGIPLFTRCPNETKLTLENTHAYNGCVDLLYTKRLPTVL